MWYTLRAIIICTVYSDQDIVPSQVLLFTSLQLTIGLDFES